MKLYDWKGTPNPKRVRMFLAEKGLKIDVEQVGGEGFKLAPEFVQMYSQATVPMLALDDGLQLGEAMAICRYLEELHPEPPLFGIDPRDRAIVEMWERRAYEEGMLAVAEFFRNAHPAFVGRGVAGTPDPVAQIPALIDRGRQRLGYFYDKFDRQLASNPFVAGQRFTVADCTVWSVIELASAVQAGIPDHCTHLQRWWKDVSERPSAQA